MEPDVVVVRRLVEEIERLVEAIAGTYNLEARVLKGRVFAGLLSRALMGKVLFATKN